jgi:hypothetical protein
MNDVNRSTDEESVRSDLVRPARSLRRSRVVSLLVVIL